MFDVRVIYASSGDKLMISKKLTITLPSIMNTCHCFVVFVLLFSLCSVSKGNHPTNTSTSPVNVRITKVDITDTAFRIQVEMSNLSDKPLSLWDLDAEPGRQYPIFIFPDLLGGSVRVFRKENQEDYSGKPKMITIPPKGAKRWNFDLFDSTWNIPGHVGSGTIDLVRVEVSAPATEAAERGEVWAGTVSSETAQMNKTLAQIWPAQAIPLTSKLTKKL